MNKKKKGLILAGVIFDASVTIFLFVISIIMIILVAKYTVKYAPDHASGLILFLLQHTTFYFWVFVFPLFLLLAANIIGLVFYVKKTSIKENTPTKLDDLSEEQKEALRKELLKDLLKDTQNNNEE